MIDLQCLNMELPADTSGQKADKTDGEPKILFKRSVDDGKGKTLAISPKGGVKLANEISQESGRKNSKANKVPRENTLKTSTHSDKRPTEEKRFQVSVKTKNAQFIIKAIPTATEPTKSMINIEKLGESAKTVSQEIATKKNFVSNIFMSPKPNNQQLSPDKSKAPSGKSVYFLFRMKEFNIIDKKGDTKYKCHVCNGIYKQKFSLKRHFMRNHINPKYISLADLSNCKIKGESDCMPTGVLLQSTTPTGRKRFKSNNAIFLDHNRNRLMPGLFKCHECCNINLDTEQDLKVHYLIHQNTGSDSFSCNECSAVFYKKIAFAKHMATHSGKKVPSMTFRCKRCKLEFALHTDYIIHLSTHGSGKNCKYCNKQFSTPANRKRHENLHEGGHGFTCKHCRSVFPQNSDLEIHIKKMHSSLFLICKHCPKQNTPKVFSSKFLLLTHMKDSHDIVLQESSSGSFEEIGISGMIASRPVLSPVKSICCYCKKKFPDVRSMIKHKNVEHKKTLHKIKTPGHKKHGTASHKNSYKDVIDSVASPMNLNKRKNYLQGDKMFLKKRHTYKRKAKPTFKVKFGRERILSKAALARQQTQEFYSNLSKNIAENLLCHLDGGASQLSTKVRNSSESIETAYDPAEDHIPWSACNIPDEFDIKRKCRDVKHSVCDDALCLYATGLERVVSKSEENNHFHYNGNISSGQSAYAVNSQVQFFVPQQDKSINLDDRKKWIQHDVKIAFLCSVCKKQFSAYTEFEEHSLNNHPNVEVTYLEVEGDKDEPPAIPFDLSRPQSFSPQGALLTCKVPSSVSGNSCTKCNASFSKPEDLHPHILKCGGKDIRPQYRKKQNPLKRIKHTMKNRMDITNSRAPLKSQIKPDRLIFKSSPSPKPAIKCGKDYFSTKNLKILKKSPALVCKQNPISCFYCQSVFDTKLQLQEHYSVCIKCNPKKKLQPTKVVSIISDGKISNGFKTPNKLMVSQKSVNSSNPKNSTTTRTFVVSNPKVQNIQKQHISFVQSQVKNSMQRNMVRPPKNQISLKSMNGNQSCRSNCNEISNSIIDLSVRPRTNGKSIVRSEVSFRIHEKQNWSNKTPIETLREIVQRISTPPVASPSPPKDKIPTKNVLPCSKKLHFGKGPKSVEKISAALMKQNLPKMKEVVKEIKFAKSSSLNFKQTSTTSIFSSLNFVPSDSKKETKNVAEHSEDVVSTKTLESRRKRKKEIPVKIIHKPVGDILKISEVVNTKNLIIVTSASEIEKNKFSDGDNILENSIENVSSDMPCKQIVAEENSMKNAEMLQKKILETSLTEGTKNISDNVDKKLEGDEMKKLQEKNIEQVKLTTSKAIKLQAKRVENHLEKAINVIEVPQSKKMENLGKISKSGTSEAAQLLEDAKKTNKMPENATKNRQEKILNETKITQPQKESKVSDVQVSEKPIVKANLKAQAKVVLRSQKQVSETSRVVEKLVKKDMSPAEISNTTSGKVSEKSLKVKACEYPEKTIVKLQEKENKESRGKEVCNATKPTAEPSKAIEKPEHVTNKEMQTQLEKESTSYESNDARAHTPTLFLSSEGDAENASSGRESPTLENLITSVTQNIQGFDDQANEKLLLPCPLVTAARASNFRIIISDSSLPSNLSVSDSNNVHVSPSLPLTCVPTTVPSAASSSNTDSATGNEICVHNITEKVIDPNSLVSSGNDEASLNTQDLPLVETESHVFHDSSLPQAITTFPSSTISNETVKSSVKLFCKQPAKMPDVPYSLSQLNAEGNKDIALQNDAVKPRRRRRKRGSKRLLFSRPVKKSKCLAPSETIVQELKKGVKNTNIEVADTFSSYKPSITHSSTDSDNNLQAKMSVLDEVSTSKDTSVLFPPDTENKHLNETSNVSFIGSNLYETENVNATDESTRSAQLRTFRLKKTDLLNESPSPLVLQEPNTLMNCQDSISLKSPMTDFAKSLATQMKGKIRLSIENSSQHKLNNSMTPNSSMENQTGKTSGKANQSESETNVTVKKEFENHMCPYCYLQFAYLTNFRRHISFCVAKPSTSQTEQNNSETLVSLQHLPKKDEVAESMLNLLRHQSRQSQIIKESQIAKTPEKDSPPLPNDQEKSKLQKHECFKCHKIYLSLFKLMQHRVKEHLMPISEVKTEIVDSQSDCGENVDNIEQSTLESEDYVETDQQSTENEVAKQVCPEDGNLPKQVNAIEQMNSICQAKSYSFQIEPIFDNEVNTIRNKDSDRAISAQGNREKSTDIVKKRRRRKRKNDKPIEELQTDIEVPYSTETGTLTGVRDPNATLDDQNDTDTNTLLSSTDEKGSIVKNKYKELLNPAFLFLPPFGKGRGRKKKDGNEPTEDKECESNGQSGDLNDAKNNIPRKCRYGMKRRGFKRKEPVPFKKPARKRIMKKYSKRAATIFKRKLRSRVFKQEENSEDAILSRTENEILPSINRNTRNKSSKINEAENKQYDERGIKDKPKSDHSINDDNSELQEENLNFSVAEDNGILLSVMRNTTEQFFSALGNSAQTSEKNSSSLSQLSILKRKSRYNDTEACSFTASPIDAMDTVNYNADLDISEPLSPQNARCVKVIKLKSERISSDLDTSSVNPNLKGKRNSSVLRPLESGFSRLSKSSKITEEYIDYFAVESSPTKSFSPIVTKVSRPFVRPSCDNQPAPSTKAKNSSSLTVMIENNDADDFQDTSFLNNYTCPICNKSFQSAAGRKRHMSCIHHRKSISREDVPSPASSQEILNKSKSTIQKQSSQPSIKRHNEKPVNKPIIKRNRII